MTTLLLALSTQMQGLQITACAVVGAAVFMATWWAFRILQTEDLQQGVEWRYDISRINELRRIDPFYRVFQPILRLLARINRAVFRDALPEIQRQIQAAGMARFWLAEEFVARAELIALMTFPFHLWLFYSWFGMTGILVSMLAGLIHVGFLRFRLAQHAAYRLYMIKRRMPFLLDLLTLLMEAGSTFMNALTQAVQEFEGHPVAEEFGRVMSDMNLGKTRTEAFSAMRDRLHDDEITSIIGSILQGEYLGTPLAHIFRTQADVLRLKRTQRAETIAGEAGVNMLMPGVLIMISTVLIIVGPFLLNYLYFGMSM